MKNACAVGDSQGAGLTEHAIREVKVKIRTLKKQVAATSVNTGRREPDGRTVWDLRHGRPLKREVAEFSEQILYLFRGQAKVQFKVNFVEGYTLGLTTRTYEISVGMDRGVLRARSFLRLPTEQRSDRDSLVTAGSLDLPVRGDTNGSCVHC